ncbi:MAG TPA: cupredoxin family copper-binding protein [Roseiarcus sp.]|nr:cupredoxin family copper-binding protein [Roseiarcus sp.]
MRTLTKPHAFARFALTALIVAALSALAIGSVFADEAKVAIDNFAFVPETITIKPGTTVTFENRDDIPHLVVDAASKFRSKALDTGDTFSVKFDSPGEFPYFCGLHPHMKGKVIVAP